MVKVEFIRDFKDCYLKGSTKEVHPHFAKAVSVPQKHKMMEEPTKTKRLNGGK